MSETTEERGPILTPGERAILKRLDRLEALLSPVPPRPRGDDDRTPAELLAMPIGHLGLGVRPRKALARLKCFTIGDATQVTWEDVGCVKGAGTTTRHEIRNALLAVGLDLLDGAPPVHRSKGGPAT